MSGHNKWSKIKHKKAATDAKKSKEFTRLVKLLKVESRAADGNVESPGLKTAIEKAKAANMPKDNIRRAIDSGTKPGEALEQITYELYGPSGSAIIVEAITDNTNRTGSEIKHLLSKQNFLLANPGSATWGFEKTIDGWTPNTMIDMNESDTEKLTKLIETLEEHDDVQDVFTNAQSS